MTGFDESIIFGLMKNGTCLCGEIKFEIEGEIRWGGACHCRMCQRQSAGAFQVWAAFNANDLKVISGTVKNYKSSANVIRSSCSTCSSHLFFKYIDNDKDIYVSAMALDGADIKPETHIWWTSKQEWLCMNDGIETRPD